MHWKLDKEAEFRNFSGVGFRNWLTMRRVSPPQGERMVQEGETGAL